MITFHLMFKTIEDQCQMVDIKIHTFISFFVGFDKMFFYRRYMYLHEQITLKKVNKNIFYLSFLILFAKYFNDFRKHQSAA